VINGVKDDTKKMLEQLKSKAASFEIVARRPEEFLVAISKKEAKAPLGLEFPKKPTGTALLITKVHSVGAFNDWNEGAGHHKVRDMDRVVSVAYSQGKAQDLQKKMTAAASFHAGTAATAECVFSPLLPPRLVINGLDLLVDLCHAILERLT